LYSIPALATLVSAVFACASDLQEDATIVPPVKTITEPTASGATPVRPIALDRWREIQKLGRIAARSPGLDERIDKCRAFIEDHADHQEAGAVLAALSDSLVERGDYDASELVHCVELRAELDEDDFSLPIEMVREFHIKHDLPLASALSLLKVSRKRIARQWKDLEFETDERYREYREAGLRHGRTQTYVVEGRLHVERNEPSKALAALDKAEREAAEFATDIIAIDAGGKTHTLVAGTLDELHLLRAAALMALERPGSARASLGRTLGFFTDPRLLSLYESTRDALGMRSSSEQVVRAPPLMAQNFELSGLDGTKVRLSDFRGKVVIMTFFSTWCGPCRREMPELEKFQRQHADKGVVVLAVSIDRFQDRSKIGPFLESQDIKLQVLLEEPEQLSEYDYRGIPALYVIDREGRIAHARTGYDPAFKDRLKHEIREIVEGNREAGRELLTIELAPAGYAVLWQKPVTGALVALAIAPPHEGQPGEIGAVGRKGLMRWSPTGELLGEQALTGESMRLHAADLDRNGSREWIVNGYQDLKVLDSDGEIYWEHKTRGFASVAGLYDFNADGFVDIAMREGERAVVMQAVPEPLWRSRPFKELESVVVVSGGEVMVQAKGEIFALDAKGKDRSAGTKPPEGRTLGGRLEGPGGSIDLFGGMWDPRPLVEHDVDGDGGNDVVIPAHGGLVAYDAGGLHRRYEWREAA
jgi:thiol-disulfide isomerase/thioredoxin